MQTEEEVLAKALQYKVLNDLPSRLLQVQSEWEASHEFGTIELPPDPIVGFKLTITEVIISGWDTISDEELLNRINRFPAAFCYVTTVAPKIAYEQEDTEELRFQAGIKVVDQGTSRSILEKIIYRYTFAVYQMMRDDPYLSGSGWYVENLLRAYSATVPSSPLLKSGMVGFSVLKGSKA